MGYVNTDFNEKFEAFTTNDARKYKQVSRYLELLGYKIVKRTLTDEGVFGLLAILKKKPLVRCLLIEKKMPMNDKVYPPSKTYPDTCEFYSKGVCRCVNHKFCIYQNTTSNVNVLEHMVHMYDIYGSKSYHDETSSSYEDTEIGRIFSSTYEHLNYQDIERDKRPTHYRHNGR